MAGLLYITALFILLLACQGCQSDIDRAQGERLLEERCSVCHKADIPKNARKSRSEWERTVTKMMDRGAKLSPEEKKILVRYLSAVYRR
jgi:mono/diheme cytochrome c family protein